MDFFKPKLSIEEHSSDGYAGRTKFNAANANGTVAIAKDFTTHGEVLTENASKEYLGVEFDGDMTKGAASISQFVRTVGGSLNIAGNGIYSLQIPQAEVNQKVYDLLKNAPISAIRSGGQTGVDWAGLVSGIKMGVPTTGMWPKGFKMRGRNGKDFSMTREQIEERLLRESQALV